MLIVKNQKIHVFCSLKNKMCTTSLIAVAHVCALVTEIKLLRSKCFLQLKETDLFIYWHCHQSNRFHLRSWCISWLLRLHTYAAARVLRRPMLRALQAESFCSKNFCCVLCCCVFSALEAHDCFFDFDCDDGVFWWWSFITCERNVKRTYENIVSQ